MYTYKSNNENLHSDMKTSALTQQISLTRPALTPLSTNITAAIESVDQQDANDPQRLGMYAQEIYEYLLQRETLFMSQPDYMARQTDINYKMRAVVIDWLITVHLKFKLMPETLYLTVSIFDRYLSKSSVKRQDLQLVGATALLIASKYEEIYPPETSELIYLTDKAYDKEQMKAMEIGILNKLEFEMTVPSSWRFLERYSRICEMDDLSLNISRYLIELALLDYRMIKYRPSIIAASAVFITQRLLRKEPAWNSILLHYSKYEEKDLRSCSKDLLILFQGGYIQGLNSLKEKFGRSEYSEVSKIRLSNK
jgi:hypothetical protein